MQPAQPISDDHGVVKNNVANSSRTTASSSSFPHSLIAINNFRHPSNKNVKNFQPVAYNKVFDDQTSDGSQSCSTLSTSETISVSSDITTNIIGRASKDNNAAVTLLSVASSNPNVGATGGAHSELFYNAASTTKNTIDQKQNNYCNHSYQNQISWQQQHHRYTRKISNGSTTTTSASIRRDSLPMGLRNKMMKPTDCLLFAATLIDQEESSSFNCDALRHEVGTSISIVERTSLQGEGKALQTLSDKAGARVQEQHCGNKVISESKIKNVKEAHSKQRFSSSTALLTVVPNDSDVLCGRGGKVNKHKGNVIYRKIVDYNKSFYQSVHKKHRILVSKSIVQAILNNGGRFLGQVSGQKKNVDNDDWVPIDFKRAVQKTSQALRELKK